MIRHLGARLFGRGVDVEAVVREHGPRVRSLLRKTFGPGVDVDDLCQIAMLEIVRSLPGFKGDSQLSTWIHRVVLNVAYQEMRRAYRRPELVDVDDVEASGALAGGALADGDDAHDRLERQESERLLYAAIAALPPHQRFAVVLHDLHGLTLKDAAEQLQTPLSTVAARVQSGRAALADALGEALRQRKPRSRARARRPVLA